jgi:hypothetical protein
LLLQYVVQRMLRTRGSAEAFLRTRGDREQPIEAQDGKRFFNDAVPEAGAPRAGRFSGRFSESPIMVSPDYSSALETVTAARVKRGFAQDRSECGCHSPISHLRTPISAPSLSFAR